jgi:uncharacterized repeat protein (TIGR01451 family)
MTGRAAVVAALLLMPAALLAQQSGIEITTAATVEVLQKNEKGEKVAVQKDLTAAKVVPGDTVSFTLTYANRGAQPATNVTVIDPVPEHLAYVDGSAQGTGTRIEFSVDGGKTYRAPDKLTITGGDGKVRPAQGPDYTHIRWTVTAPLAAGGNGTVSFKARVK